VAAGRHRQHQRHVRRWSAGPAVEITDSCQVRLGHPDAGPVLACAIADAAGPGAPAGGSATAVWSAQRTMLADRSPSAVMPLPAKATSIGRAQDNDIVVADLGVSRRHAELRRAPGGGYEIADLGSHNGTFLNGQRVNTAMVTEADVIGVGLATFRLVGDELQEFVDAGISRSTPGGSRSRCRAGRSCWTTSASGSASGACSA